MQGVSRATLRTKTGCLTCRERRKKCDERLPVCQSCNLSGRQCQWPTPADLLDRRFASHDRSRHRNTHPRAGTEQESNNRSQVATAHLEPLCTAVDSGLAVVLDSSAALGAISHDLEPVVLRHFTERFYGLLLLPNCHPSFYDGWLVEIQNPMVHHRSLYYSVLACGASHLYLSGLSSRMQELALIYYSNSICELSRFLHRASKLENHNGLLISVMLLCLHGCYGCDTYADIPRHVAAAMSILTLRLLGRPSGITQLFDKLAIESILYQIFLVTTGLWSDSTGLHHDLYADFWTQAERLLDQSMFFPRRPRSLNSPVLGIPVSLFRLTRSLHQQCRSRFPRDRAIFDRIRREVVAWEEVLHTRQEPNRSTSEAPDREERAYRDTGHLYAIIASVLLEQLLRNQIRPGAGPVAASDSWQVRKAVQILRGHRHDDGWTRLFVGNWSVYTLGFLVSSTEDIELIRADLRRRWNLTRFAQIARFSRDLEKMWSAREQAADTARRLQVDTC